MATRVLTSYPSREADVPCLGDGYEPSRILDHPDGLTVWYEYVQFVGNHVICSWPTGFIIADGAVREAWPMRPIE